MKQNEKIDTTLFDDPEKGCFILVYLIETFEKFRDDRQTLEMAYNYCLLAINSNDDKIINYAIEPFCLLLRGQITSKMENDICTKLKKLMNKKNLSIATRERTLYGYLLSFSALSLKQKNEWYSFLSNGKRFKYKKLFETRPLYRDRIIHLWKYRQSMIELAKVGKKIWEKHNKEE